jgi:predicted RNase H-like HicB family nuclease
MKMMVVIHEAEEGEYWAEVPALPGCFSEGESMDEMLANIREAIVGCLSAEAKKVEVGKNDRVVEVEV